MNNIQTIFGLRKAQGDVGIEVEMELNKPIGLEKSPYNWVAHSDGSLRGYSVEWVSNNPISIGKIEKHITDLKEWLTQGDYVIQDSFRAGVHVHLNCQHLTLQQVATIAAVYYCLEEPLTKFCGTNRQGNLFCLRLKDAEYPLTRLHAAIIHNDAFELTTDNIRYAALNFASLSRHGSLEFRAMRTAPDISNIVDWARMIYSIREYAIKLEDRSTIAHDISFFGPEDWARTVLSSSLYEKISYQNIGNDILNSMRNIQELLFMWK